MLLFYTIVPFIVKKKFAEFVEYHFLLHSKSANMKQRGKQQKENRNIQKKHCNYGVNVHNKIRQYWGKDGELWQSTKDARDAAVHMSNCPQREANTASFTIWYSDAHSFGGASLRPSSAF